VLAKHHFAVLEGPPEMGKTAIAWMISVAQLANGWQAIACDQPEDFFRSHQHGTTQVFVADDAFGRTEYDPTLGAKWEKQLDRVLAFVDERHWLIWTSRRHILERATREMDLQGKASSFPDPGAVLVNASQLNDREKALILYRHARAANLEAEAKQILKNNVHMIVSDSSFTPERIRRFVQTSLPKLVRDLRNGQLRSSDISKEIREAIENPTDRMIKSFRALPAEHKWVLISLLEQGHLTSPNSLEEAYSRFFGGRSTLPFHQILDELTEAFVRTVDWPGASRKMIEWIHPSYRDLVIGELGDDKPMRMLFLDLMDFEGIVLAVSQAGGARGQRQLPLLRTESDWVVFERRCTEICDKKDPETVASLLRVLRSTAVDLKHEPRQRVGPRPRDLLRTGTFKLEQQ